MHSSASHQLHIIDDFPSHSATNIPYKLSIVFWFQLQPEIAEETEARRVNKTFIVNEVIAGYYIETNSNYWC